MQKRCSAYHHLQRRTGLQNYIHTHTFLQKCVRYDVRSLSRSSNTKAGLWPLVYIEWVVSAVGRGETLLALIRIGPPVLYFATTLNSQRFSMKCLELNILLEYFRIHCILTISGFKYYEALTGLD